MSPLDSKTAKKIRKHSKPVTVGAILSIAAAIMILVFILWYLFGYDYVIAPVKEVSMEAVT